MEPNSSEREITKYAQTTITDVYSLSISNTRQNRNTINEKLTESTYLQKKLKVLPIRKTCCGSTCKKCPCNIISKEVKYYSNVQWTLFFNSPVTWYLLISWPLPSGPTWPPLSLFFLLHLRRRGWLWIHGQRGQIRRSCLTRARLSRAAESVRY